MAGDAALNARSVTEKRLRRMGAPSAQLASSTIAKHGPVVLVPMKLVPPFRDCTMKRASGSVSTFGTERRAPLSPVTNIRITDGDHEVDCRVDNMNVMLKAQYLRKI